MSRSYEICWHIFRMGNKDSVIKAVGKDCPCTYDPENNPKCPLYKAVKVHQN
jgi:hypothetical protein